MSRRAVKKDSTRTQILSVAADLFAQQGYEQTSIDEIAQKADIAKGTFYYHFESKEDVVRALRKDSFINTIDAALESLNSGSSPLRVIEQVFLERAAWTEKNPDLTKVFFEQRIHQFLFRENDAFVFPGINTPGKSSEKEGMRFFQLIYELVLAGQEKKEIRKDIDASELTQIIIATFIHAQGSWLGGYSGISLIDKVHRWFHAILDGLYDQSVQTEHICSSH
jgi:AcrR family transcriptional regulator